MCQALFQTLQVHQYRGLETKFLSFWDRKQTINRL